MTMTPCTGRRPAVRAAGSRRPAPAASAARLGRSLRRSGTAWACAVAAAMLSAGLPVLAQGPGARPALDHEDTYRWNTIRSPRISADGAWAAWVVEPWDSDPELVVSRTDGTVSRRLRGRGPVFTRDSRHVAYTVPPPQAEVDALRREGKSGDELPGRFGGGALARRARGVPGRRGGRVHRGPHRVVPGARGRGIVDRLSPVRRPGGGRGRGRRRNGRRGGSRRGGSRRSGGGGGGEALAGVREAPREGRRDAARAATPRHGKGVLVPRRRVLPGVGPGNLSRLRRLDRRGGRRRAVLGRRGVGDRDGGHGGRGPLPADRLRRVGGQPRLRERRGGVGAGPAGLLPLPLRRGRCRGPGGGCGDGRRAGGVVGQRARGGVVLGRRRTAVLRDRPPARARAGGGAARARRGAAGRLELEGPLPAADAARAAGRRARALVPGRRTARGRRHRPARRAGHARRGADAGRRVGLPARDDGRAVPAGAVVGRHLPGRLRRRRPNGRAAEGRRARPRRDAGSACRRAAPTPTGGTTATATGRPPRSTARPARSA